MGIILDDVKKRSEDDAKVFGDLLMEYVALGRKLEREELVRDMRRDFLKVLAETDAAQAEIEAYEDQVVADIKKLAGDGPIKAEMIKRFEALMNEIDLRHTAVIKDQRNPKFKAIFENYLPSLVEEK